MTEGQDEEAAAACFGRVTARLQRLFCRLPKKSRSLSEKLQVLQRFEARRAPGRSWLLPLAVCRGAWAPRPLPSSFSHRKGVQGPPGSLVLMLSVTLRLDPPDCVGTKAPVLPPWLA